MPFIIIIIFFFSIFLLLLVAVSQIKVTFLVRFVFVAFILFSKRMKFKKNVFGDRLDMYVAVETCWIQNC